MSTDAIDIRVRLQGGRVASVEADGVAASVNRIGDAAERTTGKMAALRAAAGGFAGGITKVGEASKMGALYLGGFSAAVAGAGAFVGVKFNADMEQATIAMTHFLGSSKAAKKYLDDLYVLAAHTPFEFKSLTQTAEQFMAFGYSAKGAKDMLTSLADAAAGLGKSDGDLAPVTLALGQIKAAGTLKGQDLNQLTSFGISATGIAKNLGMTYTQMRKAMEKGKVGSSDALQAIRKTMDGQFGGMAKAQANTFSGQLSTLRDMTARTLGTLSLPLFEWLRDKGLPGINAAMPGIQKALSGVFSWLGEKAPVAIAAVRKGFSSFLDAVKPAQPFFANVLGPLLKGFALGVMAAVVGALKVAVPLFKGLMQVLGFVGTAAKPLRPVFEGVGFVLGYITAGPVTGFLSKLSKFPGVFRIVGLGIRALTFPLRAGGAAFGWFAKIGGRAVEHIATAPGRALAGLRAGLGAMLDGVRGFGGRFTSAGKSIMDSMVQGIKSALGSLSGFGKGIYNAIAAEINHALPDKIKVPGPVPDIPLPHNPIPMLAKGGVVSGAGSWITGEAGPELNTLDGNGRVRVQPLSHSGPMAPVLAGRSFVEVHAPVYLDGRKVGDAVGRAVIDRDNRR